jgi:hypothetical protein
MAQYLNPAAEIFLPPSVFTVERDHLKEWSIQLKDLSPILSLDNIAFVSLQYGNVKEQLISFNNRHNFNIQEFDLVDNFKDLDGHASLIDACDFVITISNTSAHLSGALGKETYLLCPSGEGLLWYWSHQLNGKSLWYPSINIHKQTGQLNQDA